MNRIDERFAKVKADGRKALITFLTVGDPNMEVSEKAEDHLIDNGSDFEYGARPLKRVIQKEIEDPISELVLKGDFKDKKVLHVDTDEKGALTFKTE